jgi:tetratricopeptide (TPR) repeat protein
MKLLATFFVLVLTGMTLPVASCRADSANDYFNNGYARHQSGDLKEAIKLYTKAIDADNRFVMAYQMRGAALQKMKKYQNAISDYSMVIAQGEPTFQAIGYFNRGVVKNMIGDYGGAIEDFTMAISIDKRMAAAFFHRAIARTKNGDLIGNNEDFRKAARMGDPDAERWLDRSCPGWRLTP